MGGFELVEIKNYIPGDEHAILDLFQVTFGKSLSAAYWKWRFIDNPVTKVMIKLMWHEGLLVGHYGISPTILNYNDEKILSALSMTTMTHPDYTGRKIFTDLAEALYKDEEKKTGLKVVWGFPNNNSHYGFIKNLKWNDLEQIPTLSVSTNKIKTSDSKNISVISNFTKEHILTGQNLLSNYAVKIERSVEYLAWRYLKNPTNSYTVFEYKNNQNSYYAIVKIFSSFIEKNKFEVDILELSFPTDLDILLSLLNAIKEHYKKHEVIKINTWLPIKDEKHIILEKIGFINTLPITYSGIRILDDRYDELNNAKNWFYSMGDSDIY